MGITLDRLEINTCNKQWEKKYIDRTDEKFKLEPLRKKLLLKNLGIYWINDATLIGGDSPDRIMTKMEDMILTDYKSQIKKDEYIIAISAITKLL